MNTKFFSAGFLCAILLISCQSAPPELELPKLTGYKTIQLKDIQDQFAVVLPLLAKSRPDLLIAFETINGVVKCYQEQGAVQVQGYSKTSDPLDAGIVTIVDHNRVTSPETLVRCALSSTPAGIKSSELEFCYDSYTHSTSSNKFYIAYIGTTKSLCSKFCSQLTGCSKY